MADDDPAEVEQITRPVAAEAALVVSADIKPLDSPQDGWRWFVPAGGVVFARDGTKSSTITVRDPPGRAGQFPHVTAFIGNDSDPAEDRAEIDKHADNIFVLGVAPDGTRVSGEEVERNRHSFSRISVQVAGTCTLAAQKTERFRFGDLVCASLLEGDTLRFKGGDKGFVTRDLVPWQPNQMRQSPTSRPTRSSPAAVSYNLLHGLESFAAANNNAKLLEPGSTGAPVTVSTALQESWSTSTWTYLKNRYRELAGGIGSVDEFAGLAFDGQLRAKIGDDDILRRSDPTVESGLLSVSDAKREAYFAEYERLKEANEPQTSLCPRVTHGQLWRAVVNKNKAEAEAGADADASDADSFASAAESAELYDSAAGVPPDAPSAPTSASGPELNRVNLLRCLFFEACGRGPLRIPDALLEAYLDDDFGEWKQQLIDYCTMVDTKAGADIENENKRHRRAALRWASSTTAPFARVLEVGVNELRVELLCHLGAE